MDYTQRREKSIEDINFPSIPKRIHSTQPRGRRRRDRRRDHLSQRNKEKKKKRRKKIYKQGGKVEINRHSTPFEGWIRKHRERKSQNEMIKDKTSNAFPCFRSRNNSLFSFLSSYHDHHRKHTHTYTNQKIHCS